MKIAGLITEYNPFHNGHLYHIEQARTQCNADFIVVVMSGNFVQRGAPAIYDKYTRTRMALLGGADLVLEIPSAFAVSSAEDFAACGIAILDRLNVVDSVCFGSECGKIEPLLRVASILTSEPDVYTEKLKMHLKSGLTYPDSRNRAIDEYLDEEDRKACLLSSPNNILGIEYCKALLKRKSPIKPVTIVRTGSGYHDTTLENSCCSASAIRDALKKSAPKTDETLWEQLSKTIPLFVRECMEQTAPIFTDDLSSVCQSRILQAFYRKESLTEFADVSEELENRLQKNIFDFCRFEELISRLKTKQYTYTRISRALLHILLEIKKEDIDLYRAMDYCAYARVLGFRKSSVEVMKQIKDCSSLPLITKMADASNKLSENGKIMFNHDLYCSHLYSSLVRSKYRLPIKNEYTQGCQIL